MTIPRDMQRSTGERLERTVFFGSAVVQGAGLALSHANLTCVIGSAWLDLRAATLAEPEVTVECFLLFGSLELAAEVARSVPKTRVVILTTFARSGYLRRALAAGASGYLLKDAPAPELAAAVRHVYAGGRAIDPELAAEAWGQPDSLSERERVCLRLAGQGCTSPEIAEALGLSVGTVRNYLSEAIGKLGAGNRTQAARLAREKGWL
jgi:two-component system response regulator DesR